MHLLISTLETTNALTIYRLDLAIIDLKWKEK